MPTFVPPGLVLIPQVNFAESKSSPPSRQVNPQGYNLMKYFPERARGVNVWKMTDGTYWMSDPVDDVAFVGEIGWPYPDTPDPVNNAISSSWYPGGPGGVGGSGPGGDIQVVSPNVEITYLGGHSYSVSTAEAADLTAVGLGAFLS